MLGLNILKKEKNFLGTCPSKFWRESSLDGQLSMADERPGGVDYSGFSFDEKMRVYYSARPYAFAWARAARLPSDPARPHAGKLFPYEPMHQWLSYGGSDRAADAFSKREFSFTLANDVYIRSAPRAPPPCPAGPRAAALRTPRGTD